MWGSQNWNQWAFQPATYNDVPADQIDWAAMAKQWIQMQQVPSDSEAPAPPAVPPPVGNFLDSFAEVTPPAQVPKPSPPPPPPPGAEPFAAEKEAAPIRPKAQPNDQYHWSKPQWVPPAENRPWAPPLVKETPAPLPPGTKETFDYGHMADNPPMAMQTIDYNHMSEYSYDQPMYPHHAPGPHHHSQGPYDPYWSHINSAPPPMNHHMFLKKDRPLLDEEPSQIGKYPPYSGGRYDPYWSHVNATAPSVPRRFLKHKKPEKEETEESDWANLDAAKRKSLPAWIRDGLEKMEQEKQKRLEREKFEQQQKNEKDETEIVEAHEADSLTKSKFDSDNEEEEMEDAFPKEVSPPPKRITTPVEDLRTEEEKKQDLMLYVRRMLTEVLLSVTNSEMLAIAQDVYKKMKLKGTSGALLQSMNLIRRQFKLLTLCERFLMALLFDNG